jgi:hypothetical protein
MREEAGVSVQSAMLTLGHFSHKLLASVKILWYSEQVADFEDRYRWTG